MLRKSSYYTIIVTLFTMLFACKKDSDVYTIKDGVFAGGALQASAQNVVLTQATENDTALTFHWSAADFGQKPVVGYVLQLGQLTDTANNWSTAKEFTVGANVLQYGFIGKELNGLLNTMGLPSGTANELAVRIKAAVPQNTGAASSIPPVYSNTTVVKVSSYETYLYVPGDYQGWSPNLAPKLKPVDGRPGMYEGYVYMKGSSTMYFKFTNAPDWDHTNYGDGGNGSFSTDGLAAGLSVPTGGYYYLTADLNTNKWTATKTNWGILGDATPGGWDNDTPLSYDEASQTWRVTCAMKANASFKFRANNAWALDFGLDPSTGKLHYANNPFLGYTDGMNNITVPSDGTYLLVLDLHQSGMYTWSYTKQ
ncbi:uncharacterized protein DUF5019 [Chitinophaga skermanii]|uniref:Uncharacterized protein DUF5019 n=1 Tax=Chitinophaga skermanii TaxID=331697 RepID=A0A327QF25_9BACT|nr:SusE domain-containing protein [Chitinophaga skermanii]RAJ02374.1 uncharacterized protein DUF5019 [Chitinophaga skermanii]